MINDITIAGKTYPVVVSIGAIRHYAFIKNLPFNSIADLDLASFVLEDYAILLYSALKVTAYNEGNSIDISQQDVTDAFIMNDDTFNAFIRILNTDFSGDAEKK